MTTRTHLVAFLGLAACASPAGLQASSPQCHTAGAPEPLLLSAPWGAGTLEDAVGAALTELPAVIDVRSTPNLGRAAFTDALSWQVTPGAGEVAELTGTGWPEATCPTGRMATVPLQLTLTSAEGLSNHGDGTLSIHEDGGRWLRFWIDGAPPPASSAWFDGVEATCAAGDTTTTTTRIGIGTTFDRGYPLDVGLDPGALSGSADLEVESDNGRCARAFGVWSAL